MTVVEAFVNHPRFNQELDLPANTITGHTAPFKVTYADYGAHPSPGVAASELKVLLWFAPMLGSRLGGITRHEAAAKHGLRIVAIDRPGMGGTTKVDVDSRIRVTREITIAVLGHLNISEVQLGAHSGGAVYALDFALHHVELLNSKKALIFLGAPWILPSHTSAGAMATIQKLPGGMVSNTHLFARCGMTLGGLVGSGVGMSSSVITRFWPSTSPPKKDEGNHDEDEVKREGAFTDEVWASIGRKIYSENTTGISDEASLLLLKSDMLARDGWGDWRDYHELIPRLQSSLAATKKKISIYAYYAENDWMIGNPDTKGPKWLDECWIKAATLGDAVEFKSESIKGADHDGIWHAKWGATKKMYDLLEEL